ncbi:MAG: hypothetical protein JWN67_3966 [Actinomycetia bacterium]|nr:hypothetical protein [Actinomycetes bacterium]
MTTHFAAVVLLFIAVASTMLLGLFAVLSLAVGDHALGFELSVMAVAVAGLTRLVTERADRSLARA